MSRGRTIIAVAMVLTLACSANVTRTVVVDKEIHHLGDDTFEDWRAPEPEGTQLILTFQLDKIKDEENNPFGFGFLLAGEDGSTSLSGTINGEKMHLDPWAINVSVDTLKARFLRTWQELVNADDAYFARLEEMMNNEGFLPVVYPGSIAEGTLVEGENTMVLKVDGSGPVVDCMIASIVVSNDNHMEDMFFRE